MTEQPDAQQERQIAQTVAEILAANLAANATLDLLKKALAPFKLPIAAVKHAYALAKASWKDPVVPGEGPVGSTVNRRAWSYRARYVIAAAKRIGRGLLQGKPLRELLDKERRYASMHVSAQRGRAQVARNVDAAVAWSQALTGRREFRWRTMRDSRVSPECRRQEGKVFRWNKPPTIKGLPTYPGAVHPHCRCVAEPVGQRLSVPSNTVIGKERSRV